MDPVFLRAYQGEKDIWTFVASTESVDRYGDVIVADGWDLKHFKKNPIALWQHNHSQPIGVWENVRVEDGKLVAQLKMVKQGVSSIADMVRNFIEQRVLRAVSVGFQPKGKPERILDDKGNWTGGYKFPKSELLEISVVSVPANAEALAVAKSLGATADMIREFFTEDGEDPFAEKTRRRSGQPARPPVTDTPSPKGNKTMNLAERIKAREASVAKLHEQINELGALESPTEDQLVQLEERTAQLEQEQKALDTLNKAAAAMAASAQRAADDVQGRPGAPATIKARGNTDPLSLLIRSAIVVVRSHVERKSVDDIIRTNFKGSQDLEVMVRAATAPAMTNVPEWAGHLVGETVGAFVDVLRPGSVFFNLPVPTFTFGRGKIKLPSRSAGTLAGSFVGEGAPIPVRAAQFASGVLEPHKLGVITVMTREMAEMSDPALEPLLREMMVGDTRDTLDGIFLDNNAAVAGIRPAGLQNLAVGNTAASTGTALSNIIADLRAAIAAMSNNNMGRLPVWIMNKQRALTLSLVTNAAGAFMFRDEIAAGTLLGIPLISSTTVPADVVFLVDAAEMGAAYDAVPQIDMSEQATIHMADPAAPIVGAGSGAAGATAITDVANPVRSLFQTASLALRLLWDLTWAQRRPKAVYTITGVAW